MAVRMRDVAERAGVSPRTVSNVVNGFRHVSPSTRERVQSALDELGYEVNAAARSLRSGRTGMIAFVVAELRSPYFAELADAVVRAADRRNLTVLIEVTEGRRDREMRVLKGGRKHLTDGVLMSPIALTQEPRLGFRRDFPVVMLGESRLGDAYDHVGLDNAAATHAVIEHLVRSGRSRIAALGVNDRVPGAVLRHKAYRAALARAGLSPHGVMRTADWDRHTGAEAIHSLVRSGGPLPDAIFAFNDTLAIGALRALLQYGIRVPAQVAVAGIDDIDEAAYMTPSLTTIAPDLSALAEQALSLLEDQIAARRDGTPQRPPRREWSPFRLVVRESTLTA
jgi:LacI family repressor for deo operon, udp, cdd, tsx, nupC, and nupG